MKKILILVGMIIGVASSSQIGMLNSDSLERFDEQFKLLSKAKEKGMDEIILKYAPGLIEGYDLIPVQFEEGEELEQYLLVKKWMVEIGEEKRSKECFEGDKEKNFNEVFECAKKWGEDEKNWEVVEKLVVNKFENAEIDSVWKWLGRFDKKLIEKHGISKTFQDQLEELKGLSMSSGSIGVLMKFKKRFPGYSTKQINSAIEFLNVDKTNLLIKSNKKEDMVTLYSTMLPGEGKNRMKRKLQKKIYYQWRNTPSQKRKMQLAGDFISLFKNEEVKTQMHREIISWEHYTERVFDGDDETAN
jgi:hypothetical protein